MKIRYSSRLFRLTTLLAGIVLLVAPQILSAIDKKWTESVPALERFHLHVNHGDGDVEVRVWDERRIDVEVIYTAADPGPGQDLEVTFDSDPYNLTVTAWEDGDRAKRRSPDDEYRIEIRAPADVMLSTSGDDGDVVVGDWLAAIETRTDDGNVWISSLVGSLQTLSDDGNLTVGSLRGDAEVRTRDGSVQLFEVATGNLRIRGLDGNVEVLLTQTPERVEITTDDGRIDIALAEAVECSFELETVEGWIEVRHPDGDRFERRRRRASGAIGNQGGTVRATTRDGDLKLYQSEELPR